MEALLRAGGHAAHARRDGGKLNHRGFRAHLVAEAGLLGPHLTGRPALHHTRTRLVKEHEASLAFAAWHAGWAPWPRVAN
jgi:hypothetical protein